MISVILLVWILNLSQRVSFEQVLGLNVSFYERISWLETFQLRREFQALQVFKFEIFVLKIFLVEVEFWSLKNSKPMVSRTLQFEKTSIQSSEFLDMWKSLYSEFFDSRFEKDNFTRSKLFNPFIFDIFLFGNSVSVFRTLRLQNFKL